VEAAIQDTIASDFVIHLAGIEIMSLYLPGVGNL